MWPTFVEISEESTAQDFIDRAKRLINRHIGVGARSRVGIRDRDAPERLPPQHPRLLPRLPLRQIQAEWREGVSVRPAVDNDAFNIACGIEARSAKHPPQLVTYVSLEFAVGRLQQLRPPRTILIPHWQTRLARGAQHEQHRRLFGLAWKLILAQAHRKIERGIRVVSPGRHNLVNPQIRE